MKLSTRRPAGKGNAGVGTWFVHLPREEKGVWVVSKRERNTGVSPLAAGDGLSAASVEMTFEHRTRFLRRTGGTRDIALGASWDADKQQVLRLRLSRQGCERLHC
jgi:hypothetical protein